MNVLRTPDERFKNLLDYPFSPNYTKCEMLEFIISMRESQ